MNRAYALKITLVAALAATVLPSAAQAKTFCVNKPGCSGESVADMKIAAAKASEAASPGLDRIELGAGTYDQTLVGFTGPVQLVGAGRDATVLQGVPDTKIGNETVGFFGEGSSVESLTFRLAGNKNYAGVKFHDTGSARDIAVVQGAPSTSNVGIVLMRGGSVENASINLPTSLQDQNNGINISTTKDKPPVPTTITDVDTTASRGIMITGRFAPIGDVTLRRVRASGGIAGVNIDGTTRLGADQLVARGVGTTSDSAGLSLNNGGIASAELGPVRAELRNSTIAGSGQGTHAAYAFNDSPTHALELVATDTAFLPGTGGYAFKSIPQGASKIVLDLNHSAWSKHSMTSYPGTPTIVNRGGNVDLERSPAGIANPATGDFSLTPGSALIDNGTPGALADGDSPTDAYGRPRLVDGDKDGAATRDIGAYEAAAGTNASHIVPVFWDNAIVSNRTPLALIKKLPKGTERVISGSATDDRRVTRVDVSVTRKVKNKCMALNSKGKIVESGSMVKGVCPPRYWHRAKGTTKWTVTLPKATPPGGYVVMAHAMDNAGAFDAAPNAKAIKLTAIKPAKKKPAKQSGK